MAKISGNHKTMRSSGKQSKITIGSAKLSSKGSGRIKYGAVQIVGDLPTRKMILRNVAGGQDALARVAKKLARPGIVIRAAKGIPLYSIDETQPTRIIRKLDGKIEFGTLKHGQFKARKK